MLLFVYLSYNIPDKNKLEKLFLAVGTQPLFLHWLLASCNTLFHATRYFCRNQSTALQEDLFPPVFTLKRNKSRVFARRPREI